MSFFDGTTLFEVTVAERRRTVFVEFGSPSESPLSPGVKLGDVWVPIVSCRDWWGEELRDDLTSDALCDIARQLGGGA